MHVSVQTQRRAAPAEGRAAPLVRRLGLADYPGTYEAMRRFTAERGDAANGVMAKSSAVVRM